MSRIEQDLTGKTYLVTGGNSGIGFEAAKDFAGRGATTLIVSRNKERGEEAKRLIIEHSQNQQVYLYIADFSLLRSVNKLADTILEKHPIINVLCNNAGGSNAIRTITSEGFETTFATNHLGSFLLTLRLLPALRQAAQSGIARVVFTSSYGHKHSPLDFNDLGLEKNYKSLKAYGRSKLMNLLTARELQKRCDDSNIVVSSFHPGAVRTPIWSKGGTVAKALGFFMNPFMVSIEKGADTLIWLASSEDVDSLQAHGHYFLKRQRAQTASFATDDAAKKLWERSLELASSYLR